MPLGGGSCLRRTGHPFAVSGPGGPSQKIESGFAASPETIQREPREFDLRRSVGKWQDLAACALCDLYVLLQAEAPRPPLSGNFLPARSPVLPDLRRADTRPSSDLRPASPFDQQFGGWQDAHDLISERTRTLFGVSLEQTGMSAEVTLSGSGGSCADSYPEAVHKRIPRPGGSKGYLRRRHCYAAFRPPFRQKSA